MRSSVGCSFLYLALVVAAPLSRSSAVALVPVQVRTVPETLTTVQRIKGIDAYLSGLVPFGFAGSTSIVADGRQLLSKGFGAADREAGVPWTPATLFDIGSITKQFTAAAILQLEIEGSLSVTDSIGRFLADVPADKAGVTLHHLLTHTSGIRMGFGGDYRRVRRDELIRTVLGSPLASKPGERHAYSNAGFSLLAAIVEMKSGLSYDRFLADRFFDRLGMGSTGYFPPGPQARHAIGYLQGSRWGSGAAQAAPLGGDFWNLIGNGGVHSTVEDMQRWMAALAEGKILNADARRKLFEPHVLVFPDYRGLGPLHYGYGWYVLHAPNSRIIWHRGGNGVFNAAVRWHVSTNTVLVHATNVSEFGDPMSPVPAIERMLTGEAIEPPPVLIPRDSARLAPFRGTYAAGTGERLNTRMAGAALELEGEGQAAFSFAIGRGWRKDQSLDSLGRRVVETIERARLARYEGLLPLLPFTNADSLRSFEERFWQRRTEELGAFVGARALGTRPSATRTFPATTFVVIDFARGRVVREYIWTGPDRIGDFGPVESVPSVRFFRVSDACFVAFDSSNAQQTRLCFDGGPIPSTALVHDGPARITLRRLP